jgi:hypothetical protein
MRCDEDQIEKAPSISPGLSELVTVGGLSVNGQKVYPNAAIHEARRELAYWTDKNEEAKAA